MEKFTSATSSTPGVLDINHGSAAVKKQKIDRLATGSSHSAMAADSTALGVLHGDVQVSEDSLVMSPLSKDEDEKRKTQRSRSPSSTKKRFEEFTLKRSSTPRLRGDRVKRMVSAPRGRRPAPRPPSPAAPLQLADHNISIDNDGDLNIRVEKLERQRVADHHYLAQIAASIATLEKHFGAAHERLTEVEEAQRSPHRDFHIRQEMRDFKAQTEQDIVKGMEITAAGIAPKLLEMQNVMLECQVALTNLQDKEAKVESYLTKLDGERPQEGQRVVGGGGGGVGTTADMLSSRKHRKQGLRDFGTVLARW